MLSIKTTLIELNRILIQLIRIERVRMMIVKRRFKKVIISLRDWEVVQGEA
jgi:hypothetical protein